MKRYRLPIAVFVAFIICFIGLKIAIKPICEHILSRQGFKNARIADISIGLSGTHITGFSYGDSSAETVGAVDIYATLNDIMSFHAGKIEVRDVTLHYPFQVDGATSSADSRIYLPAREINFSNIKISLPGPDNVSVTFTINGTVFDRGSDYQLKIDTAADEKFMKLSALTTGTMDKKSGLAKLHTELQEARITLPGTFESKRLSGWIDVDYVPGGLPSLNAQIDAGTLKLGVSTWQGVNFSASSTLDESSVILIGQSQDNNGRLNAEVTLSRKEKDSDWIKADIDFRADALGTFNMKAFAEKNKNDGWQDIDKLKKLTANTYIELKNYLIPVSVTLGLSNGTITGKLTEKNGLLTGDIKGKYDGQTQNGSLYLNIPPLTLTKGVYALKDISPYSEKFIKDATGTIGFSMRAEKKADKITSSARIYLKNFSAAIADNPIEGVSGVLDIASLRPLSFHHQTLSVASFNVGLPLSNGVVEASLDEGKTFTLHKAEWDLAGGKISSSAFSMDINVMNADVTLTASNLDLPELFKIAPMDGLDATGTVSGTLPVNIHDGSISIKNGMLESAGPGVIRYNPQQVPAFLADEGNRQIADLRVALKAFSFDTLKMTLDGELGKNQKIGLQIKGNNPEFYGGHAVSFNLNVEGPIENVLKYNPGGSQIPDSIKKQLESYENDNKSE